MPVHVHVHVLVDSRVSGKKHVEEYCMHFISVILMVLRMVHK